MPDEVKNHDLVKLLKPHENQGEECVFLKLLPYDALFIPFAL